MNPILRAKSGGRTFSGHRPLIFRPPAHTDVCCLPTILTLFPEACTLYRGLFGEKVSLQSSSLSRTCIRWIAKQRILPSHRGKHCSLDRAGCTSSLQLPYAALTYTPLWFALQFTHIPSTYVSPSSHPRSYPCLRGSYRHLP